MSPEVVEQFLHDYTMVMKMEYGQALALAGIDPEIIIQIQADVAVNVSAWLLEH